VQRWRRLRSRRAARADKEYTGALPAERPADIAVEIERALAEAERAAKDPESRDRPALFLDGRLGPPEVLWLVRAQWAKARGRRDLAVRALAEAERLLTIQCSAPCDPIARLREGFQQKLLWQAIDGLSAWTPRPEALELARRTRAVAPSGRHTPKAEALVRALSAAVAEDKARAARLAGSPPPAWDKLSQDERADELAFLLREQNGQQMSQPGACDPFDVPAGIRNPAQELVAMGRPIVARLIPHVESDVPHALHRLPPRFSFLAQGPHRGRRRARYYRAHHRAALRSRGQGA
jgi:hypothetical protein